MLYSLMIRKLMRIKRINNKEIAELLDISSPAVSMINSGLNKPSERTKTKIRDFYRLEAVRRFSKKGGLKYAFVFKY